MDIEVRCEHVGIDKRRNEWVRRMDLNGAAGSRGEQCGEDGEEMASCGNCHDGIKPEILGGSQ